ncbi:MAG: hypothetical protein AAGJ19_22465, partial [Myxococcota bacterium]
TWFGHGQPDLDTPPSRDALRGLCFEAASWGDEPEAMAAVAWLIGHVDETKAVLLDEPQLSALVAATEIWVATDDQTTDDLEKINLLDVCRDQADPLLFATMLRVGADLAPPKTKAFAIAVDRANASDHAEAFFWLGFAHTDAALRLDHHWRQILRLGLGEPPNVTSPCYLAYRLHEAVAASIEADSFAPLDALPLLWSTAAGLGRTMSPLKDPRITEQVNRVHRYLFAERLLDSLRLDDDPAPSALLDLAAQRRHAAETALRETAAQVVAETDFWVLWRSLDHLQGVYGTRQLFQLVYGISDQLDSILADSNHQDHA